MTGERPKDWPRYSRAWGPIWSGWFHMSRSYRRRLLAARLPEVRERLAPDWYRWPANQDAYNEIVQRLGEVGSVQ